MIRAPFGGASLFYRLAPLIAFTWQMLLRRSRGGGRPWHCGFRNLAVRGGFEEFASAGQFVVPDLEQ
jgi:hypothetical protein